MGEPVLLHLQHPEQLHQCTDMRSAGSGRLQVLQVPLDCV